jgi:hypothetical protein
LYDSNYYPARSGVTGRRGGGSGALPQAAKINVLYEKKNIFLNSTGFEIIAPN